MNKIPNLIYERKEYINRIRPFMRKSTIKVMTGHRRVGKSYILYQLINIIKEEESDANIIYINKEDLEFDFIREYNDLYSYVNEIP